MTYFSDRELGERPRAQEEIGEGPWGGIRVLIETAIDDGSFGIDYPDGCPDGRGPTGTNRYTFDTAMRAEIPNLPEEPWRYGWHGVPEAVDILDMIEFCWRHVGEPSNATYHDFFGHFHLTYNRDMGRFKFREQVNLIFGRNGLAYTLTGEGNIERLAPPVLREELASVQFVTGEAELDHILASARRKFLSPRDDIRREALLGLWDAWERLKTTGEGADKKDRITSLLDDAAGSSYPKFRLRLESDAKELTDIGNNHQIRHTEIWQEKVERSEHIDYLFHRLFSMIQLVLKTKEIQG